MKAAKRPRVVLTNRAIVLDKKGKILLIKRADTDSWRPGSWEFPGGKLDEGQDLSHALEREILEETGLVIIPINRVVYYESQISQMKKYKGLPYIVLVGLAKKIGGEIKLSEEHTESVWVTPQKALDYHLTSESKKALLVLKETFPKLKIDF